MILPQLAYRFATEVSPRLAIKMAYLYAYKGMLAISAYKNRMKKGELYPPFMFIALTNSCNLRCHGCWVEKEGTAFQLPMADIDALIEGGKKQKAYYYTLLGGEPMMHKGIWEVFRRHPDCYFQIITNGMLFTENNVRELRKLGNVTPLISIDGMAANNDQRRGEGVFEAADKGLELLRKNKVIFGVATTATGKNFSEVMSDSYVEHFIKKGAMYLWYYVYRPVGEHPHPEYCMQSEEIIWLRKKMLELRRKHPILIIDTYWTAEGEAFCPAAMGLGFHVNPRGGIEICPALSFAKEQVADHGYDVYQTINESQFLRGFQKFVKERTKGCVILEHPQELVKYIQQMGAKDFSTRNAFAEIDSIKPRHSHHLPGQEIPENHWLYRFMKKQAFFGMGALG